MLGLGLGLGFLKKQDFCALDQEQAARSHSHNMVTFSWITEPPCTLDAPHHLCTHPGWHDDLGQLGFGRCRHLEGPTFIHFGYYIPTPPDGLLPVPDGGCPALPSKATTLKQLGKCADHALTFSGFSPYPSHHSHQVETTNIAQMRKIGTWNGHSSPTPGSKIMKVG